MGTPVVRPYANLPLTFVANRGQADARVRFLAQGDHYAFSLARSEVVLSFTNRTRGVNLRLRFVGANPEVALQGQKRTAAEINYLRGNDPSRWQRRVPAYAQVVYRNLWPGIDAVLRGRGGELKYEFRVRPGARLSDIRLAYRGVERLRVHNRALLIRTALGVLRDAAPVAYQQVAGRRVRVPSGYVLRGNSYGFAVPRFDDDRELVIDPGLAYSTFLGGSSNESGDAIAVDASGNAYVTGLTQSPNFPTTAGAFDRTGSTSNDLDVFVSKVNATGTGLVYSTFLGGTNFDWGRALAVDSSGNAYVAGNTKSSNFPTTGNAFDRTFNIDNCPRCGIDQYDGYVAKLNASGSGLVYSTFLGGTDFDDILGLTIDGAGNAYLAGQTGSLNFPTTSSAFDTTPNGSFDGFVTKLNASGSALAYSTRLGGADNELPSAVKVDTAGNAFVAGSTRSADFPTTAGAFDTTHNGGAFEDLFDVFVTKLNAGGSALVYSTFLGGSKPDYGEDLAVDAGGNAYITGATMSPEFPTTPGAFDTVFGGSEGFVAKLNAAGAGLVYSTFLREAGASSIALDPATNAWLGGATSSPTAPTTADAFDRTYNGGGSDAYIAELNDTGSALLHATFLGGSDSEAAGDIALDSAGNVYVSGHTYSPDFPTTVGAFDRVWNGDPLIFWGDAFVAKLAAGSASPPPPPPPPPPSTLTAPSLVSPADDARFLPGTSITFDWTDVSGAASYTIQIDDSDTFSSPLTLQQTVAVSQFTTSTLPTTRMWWRVRANDASGTAGPWSAVRRFEIRT